MDTTPDDADTDAERYEMVSASVPMEIRPADLSSLPQRMVIAGVRMSGKVAVCMARSIAGSAALAAAGRSASAVAQGLARDAVSVNHLQLQAARQIFVRVPVIGSAAIDRLFTKAGVEELQIAASSRMFDNVLQVGVHGHVLTVVASLLVHESRDVLYGLSGCGSEPLLHRTACNVAAAVGGLVGGAGGTYLGTLMLPGIGTGVGSFAGSLIGAIAAEAAASEAIQMATTPVENHEYMLVEDGQETGCVELVLQEEGEDDHDREVFVECDCGDFDPRYLVDARSGGSDAADAVVSQMPDTDASPGLGCKYTEGDADDGFTLVECPS
eukprot:TRINITY_DN1701_c4_g2_i1.p1 TRINITY_DN1701_c4_g2~~TRINITY_DN1701_c4_g2_i1.p1  ORF type:complete len:326 (+),score=40.95 TRINITY_DN1701_c4_g2_i1:253-1230(+)